MNSKISAIKESICCQIDIWLSNHKEETLHSFAKKLGVSDTSVNRWKNRVCVPDIDLLPKICNIMDIPISKLLGYNEPTFLSQKEQELLTLYKENNNFKGIVDNYLSSQEFQNILNSLYKKY